MTLTKVLVYIRTLNLLHRGTIRWVNREEGGELEIKCGVMYNELEDVYAVEQADLIYQAINNVEPELCSKCFDLIDKAGFLRVE